MHFLPLESLTNQATNLLVMDRSHPIHFLGVCIIILNCPISENRFCAPKKYRNLNG